MTYIKNIEVFDRLTNLKRLDITDHPEFFMCAEKKEALEFQALHGIDKEQKKGVTFVGQSHNIVDVIPRLKALQELYCDDDLEEYLIENSSLLPNLRDINGVSRKILNIETRQKWKRVHALTERLSHFANQYAIASQLPVWYIQDEVGSAIGHSDLANLRIRPFCYSPTNQTSDTVTFSIVWPVTDIKSGTGLYKDYLDGYTEAQFRSARLHTWFNTPEDYYTSSLKQYRNNMII